MRGIVALAVVGGLSTAVHAQWSVSTLHGQALSTDALSVDGETQAGWWAEPSSERACIWTGTSASRVTLHPPSATVSLVYSVRDGTQVGAAAIAPNNRYHASLWHGSVGSWVDLHPSGVIDSVCTSIDGETQGGYVVLDASNFITHASLWQGSAATWTDIHPTGSAFVHSYLFGMGDGEQVGIVTSPGTHACMWRGSAASWIDLHPAGATSSRAAAASMGRQFGSATFAGSEHAGVWTGTAGSWFGLHPAGATSSRVNGAIGNQAVGSAVIGTNEHALLWNVGTQTWIDLHAFLPPGSMSNSVARAVWSDGRVTRVVGEHYESGGIFRPQAVLWTRCHADLDGNMQIDSGDFFAFLPAFFSASTIADFNEDGTVTSQDLFDFLAAFFAAC